MDISNSVDKLLKYVTMLHSIIAQKTQHSRIFSVINFCISLQWLSYSLFCHFLQYNSCFPAHDTSWKKNITNKSPRIPFLHARSLISLSTRGGLCHQIRGSCNTIIFGNSGPHAKYQNHKTKTAPSMRKVCDIVT